MNLDIKVIGQSSKTSYKLLEISPNCNAAVILTEKGLKTNVDITCFMGWSRFVKDDCGYAFTNREDYLLVINIYIQHVVSKLRLL